MGCLSCGSALPDNLLQAHSSSFLELACLVDAFGTFSARDTKLLHKLSTVFPYLEPEEDGMDEKSACSVLCLQVGRKPGRSLERRQQKLFVAKPYFHAVSEVRGSGQAMSWPGSAEACDACDRRLE